MKHNKVVLNSSVIIALSKLKILTKIANIFEKVMVPAAVYQEVCIKGQGLPGDKDLRKAVKEGLILVKKVRNVVMVKELCSKLSAGEAEAIVLALEENADFIVLDDKLARKKARELGLNVIGTLRILKILYNKHLIDKQTLISSIRELKRHGFWISNNIISKILKEL
ncbi:MAG: DUF3368 domain-containing protein [Thermoprotei archaeon]|nr:MAG: DUF3368 domain-containing protein [Thermoprotei archaeon]